MKTLLKTLIVIYRACLAPALGPSCRFEPSCSHYAEKAIETKGAMRGAWAAVKRICRCHPFSAGGYDPVKE